MVTRVMVPNMRFPPKDEQIALNRALRRETRDSYERWVLLIKELRLQHDASILEAERIALANTHRRK
ncbi:hypothetical protein [Novosphingobium sp.]|uniref:hypothetical protein n=1 Tax=Novosphingobium sp. TaxID=1874826 RepID=UPI00261C9620|nr:hypothetical protein [Novosphingobium sp.]